MHEECNLKEYSFCISFAKKKTNQKPEKVFNESKNLIFEKKKKISTFSVPHLLAYRTDIQVQHEHSQ